ncbi:MAG: cyaA [Chloroflexi bacterium]|nr:cyaA [Chloroflexota bacterium]
MWRILGGWRRWMPGPAIGLAVAIGLSVVVLYAPASLEPLELTAGDALFIREGGPLLGARSVEPSIVLVLWDNASRQQLSGGATPSLDQDLALYRALLEDDPLVVADVSPLYTGDAGLQGLLEGMVATGAGRKLLRDMTPEFEPWYPGLKDRYHPHIAHNPLYLDSALDSSRYLRFYPLLSFYDVDGEAETLAVQVARMMLRSTTPFEKAYVESGIMARWYLQTGFTLTERQRATGERPGPYELSADRKVPWLWTVSTQDPYSFSPAALWINYAGPPGRFRTVSYSDVVQRRTPPGFFRGAVALVGVENLFSERMPTSATQQANRPEIVAQTVQTIVDGHFIEALPTNMALGGVVVVSLMCALIVTLLRPLQSLIVVVGVAALYLAYATILYRSGTYPDLVVAPTALVLSAFLAGGYRYGREELNRRYLNDLFGRYVPRAVVDELVENPTREALAIGGTTLEITVLFADIRGFTAFSEQFTAEEVVKRLNGLLEVMVEAAFRYEGTVDKFIGDAIMVIYNAPLRQPDHALRAVKTALDMQKAAAELPGSLAFGVGIHTGDAVVGTIGTRERMEYTAIGSTVNLASRLCDTAGKGQVVVSDAVFEKLGGDLQAERRPPIHVKNVERELDTYLVTGLGPGLEGAQPRSTATAGKR